MRTLFCIILFFSLFECAAQYRFSGFISSESETADVYLSIVEDYRRMNGVYNEQIISRTSADSSGYFEFTGNMLEVQNRIYKIHTDHCNSISQGGHFNGYCEDNNQVMFIANNSDSLSLPYGFERQVFCDIQSNNPSAVALIQIDSLKEEMRYAYSEYRSAANRKLNDKKWIRTLQKFSKATGDPLAELYAYAYLSDQRHELYNYYVEDLKNNQYYQKLLSRLENSYPNSSYTQQYRRELNAHRFMLGTGEANTTSQWNLILYAILGISLLLNSVLVYRYFQEKKSRSESLRSELSKQEEKVLNLLLEEKTNKEIAEHLFLSVSTVKTHTNSIYKKLKVQSRDEAKSLFIN